MVKIKIIKIRNILLPKYQHSFDSGMDLINAGDAFKLNPGQRRLVPAGIKVEIPEGYEMQIRPRSGLAVDKGITVLNTPGTIDAGYRGEIKVILINLSPEVVEIKEQERIAQAVLNRVETIEWVEHDDLNDSIRGDGGFGSTGDKE